MILASFWGMPFGFIDYFLVPQYWHPSSLFGLMERYGVGIESFLFLFLMAGIASVTYEFFYNEKLVRLTHTGHRHYWLLYSVPVAFVVMSALFPTIAIYNMMIVGGIGAAITACLRRDLRRQMLISAFIFSMIYLVVFVLVNLIFPDFVNHSYNFDNICGLLLLGVPIEEIAVAFFAGAFWSTIYDYSRAYRDKKIV